MIELDPWTYRELSGSTTSDPVNVVFVGLSVAETMSVLASLDDPLHATVLAGDQWLRHPAAGIHRHDVSIGTERGFPPGFERMHIRLYDPGAPEPPVAPYTAGAMHHDQVVYTRRCVYPPEVATSFNIPRDWLATRLAATGWAVERVATANQGSVLQCDGRSVVSDGVIAVVRRP
jgi:hypothetical protein